MKKTKEIHEVFTPRRENVNPKMYIDRGQHEKNLYRSIKGSMHTFLCGESGSGKSWLYKKVLKEKDIKFIIVNCANASRKGSITEEIYSKCFEPGKSVKTSYTEKKTAGANTLIKAELAHEGHFSIQKNDKLLEAYQSLFKKNKGQTIIVLDNIEAILKKQTLLNELADILILLDDSEYATFQVKYLLVGVPSDVLQYFSNTKNASSVGNRIEELAKINGLERSQVLEFIHRGFEGELQIPSIAPEINKLSRHIYTVTLGIPQRIHEYCECLAYCIEDNNWEYDQKLMQEADNNWILKGLRESYIAIDSHLNADETNNGRRNQVIYALGRISTHQIDTQKVGVVISQDFPDNAPESNSGIGQVLASLAQGDTPILKKTTKSSFYTFIDPRHLMCIRLMLFKEQDTNKVKKRVFKIN